MAKEAKATGKDLAISSIELCPGLAIDSKIKMGAIWWLEEKYDLPIEKINLASGRVRDVAHVIIALALQHDPQMTEARAMELFKQLTPDQVSQMAKTIAGLFTVALEEKNSHGAGRLTESQTPKAQTGPESAAPSAGNTPA